MKSYLPHVLISLVLLFSSCGVAPTPQEAARAASFSPAPGKALLYVYRPSRLRGAAVNARVSLDRRSKGELPNGKFMCLEVPPGHHELLAGNRLIKFDAKPNSCHYFKMDVWTQQAGTMTILGPTPVPVLVFVFQSLQVPDPPAQDEIRKCGQVAALDAPITSATIVAE